MCDPVCFHAFGRPIYWYGVMIAAGFLAALAHWNLLARREGKPAGYAGDLGFWLLLSGILGARVAYVLAHWDDFAVAPLAVIRLDQGGLVYYGGFLAAAGAAAIFAHIRRERFWPFTDFAITALPLGHAFGRLGCFLNGCCYGRPSSIPWAVPLGDFCVHPVQLYEAFGELAIFITLMLAYRRRAGTGVVFALYLVLYPLLRFICEFFRGDPRWRVGILNLAQIASLALMTIGIGLLVWRLRAQPPTAAGHATGRRAP
jgi:phosphatidylglycerol:prolipoprotein diacylglycerol transferase